MSLRGPIHATPESILYNAEKVLAQTIEIEELKKELLEQARLHGMGSEREAKQLTRIRNLETALQLFIDTVEDNLLLDEELNLAWSELKDASDKARIVLEIK